MCRLKQESKNAIMIFRLIISMSQDSSICSHLHHLVRIRNKGIPGNEIKLNRREFMHYLFRVEAIVT